MSQNQHLSTFVRGEKERFKLKAGVFLFLIQNDEILLLRRYNTGIDDGNYVVPMGGHDGKEPMTQTLLREVEEEANISLNPQEIKVCHVMHRFHPMPEGFSFEQVDLFYKAETYEGIIQNMEPHKCDELQFYPLNFLPKNTVPFIRYAIECTIKGQFYSEFGWTNKS